MASNPKPRPKKAAATTAHIDAVNEMFTIMHLAYHNQFHKAYPNDEQLMLAKQLWLQSLCDIPVEQLRAGVQEAIQSERFLPNLPVMRSYCETRLSDLSLPDAYSAYLEACQAPSPKSAYTWSHAAVYYAGKASDWFFLANNSEAKAYPIFRYNYEQLCARVIQGESLTLPVQKALGETIEAPLSNKERKKRLSELRENLNL